MSIFAEIVLGEKLQEMTRRAEKAEAALAAKRADAIQHHAEMIGEFADMVNQRDAAIARAETAEAALAERDKPCVWCEEKEKVYGMVFWGSSCGAAYRTADMVEPGKFCLHCGHPIELQP